jgi:hypothetical protein
MSEELYAPGIPCRVSDYADTVKQKFIDNATTSTVRERTSSAEDLPILPPGISRDSFNAAIAELRGLVDNHVQLVDGTLDDGWYLHRPLTHDIYALDDDEYFINSAVCAPRSVEQTQAVVKWANKWLIPIYPISMGRNFGLSTFFQGSGTTKLPVMLLIMLRLRRCRWEGQGLRHRRHGKEDELCSGAGREECFLSP